MVWGKIITTLRQENEIALYLACADISDVLCDGGKLVAKTQDENVFSNITNQTSLKKISSLAKKFGADFECVLCDNPAAKQKDDIKKLNALAGKILTII